MRFSWEWLKEHINLEISANEAADLLSLRGLTVDEVIPFGDDFVFDVDITTNRPDAMNIRGIARELSAITSVNLEPVAVNYHEQTKRAQELAKISIDDPDACHRFCARVITNAKNGPSPDWMTRRLESAGMRSINLLVDITNYVLWELGHPLHGFDLDLLPEGKLIVRRAVDGEKLNFIDGEERKLDESMLVIADVNRAVGLGGIMGGADTEIGDNTVNILLECAYFEPTGVRKTAKKLGMSTEASYRFERGMDHTDIPRAIDRACSLYQKLAGADICKEMIDEYPVVHQPVIVTMNHEKLCAFSGMHITKETVARIFSALDLAAEFKETFWKVEVPSRRVDITREADLFEEIIRIVGFERIPGTLPHVHQQNLEQNTLHELIDVADRTLLSAGFTEVINYDFVDPEKDAVFTPGGAADPYKVLNPIASPQMTSMRQSLATSLMMNIQHNANRGNSGLKIYEIARTFHRSSEGPVERTVIGIALEGTPPEKKWSREERSADFFELKGVMEYLFTRLGLSGIIYDTGTVAFLAAESRADVFMAKGDLSKKSETRSAESGGDRLPIGWFGQISKEVQNKYDLPHPVFLGQIDLGVLVDEPRKEARFSRPSIYPSVTRDLSFILPAGTVKDKIYYETILETIENVGVEELADIQLIDLYSGAETEGELSMAVRVTYQSFEHTLTQEEIDGFHTKIRERLASLGVSFR